MKKYFLLVCGLLFSVLLCFGQGEKNDAGKYTSQGMTAYSAGDYPLAIDLFKKAFLLRPDYSALAYNISCCYALHGEKDSAIAWLQKTFELGSYLFLDDEDLVSLHADPRYQGLAREAEKSLIELRAKEWKPLISLPEQYSKDKPCPVVIGLHGFGTNPADFAKAIEPVVHDAGYILCCPYGPHIGGTTAFGWGEHIEAEKRILETVQRLFKDYNVDLMRTILFGFSQGGEMAFSTGLKHPEIFSAIVSVAGYYGEELNETLENIDSKKIAVYMMVGENDFQAESNVLAEQIMQAKGMRVKLIIFEGLGHAFPPNSQVEIKRALQWIGAAE